MQVGKVLGDSYLKLLGPHHIIWCKIPRVVSDMDRSPIPQGGAGGIGVNRIPVPSIAVGLSTLTRSNTTAGPRLER
jgi:hypothetical protein